MWQFRRKIGFDKALDIAKKHYPQYRVVRAFDLKKNRLFCYNFGSPDVVGSRNALVNMTDGAITYYHPLKLSHHFGGNICSRRVIA